MSEERKSSKWYVKFPADAYALGQVIFDNEVNESAVRAFAREWEGVKRLPDGFSCWPA